jgi:hypothetical protein
MVQVQPRESAIGDAKKAARQILEKGLKPGNVRGPTVCPTLRRALLRLSMLHTSPIAPMTVDQIRELNKQFKKQSELDPGPKPAIDMRKMGMFGGSDTRPVVYHDKGAKRVVELARSGDKDAGAALREIVSHFMAGNCTTMPPILRDYIIDRLRPEDIPAQPGQRGRKAHTNLHRDRAIVSAVAQLVACGFHATRNDASELECACSIVADCLNELDVKLSYDGVAKVWTKRRRVAG